VLGPAAHPSHSSGDFWCPECSSRRSSLRTWRTLAVDAREPCRSPSPSSPHARPPGRVLRHISGVSFSGSNLDWLQPRTGWQQVGGQGPIRPWPDASARTRRAVESSPTGCVPEHLGGDAVRLASTPMRSTRLPGRQTRAVPEIGRRPMGRGPDPSDVTGRPMRPATGGDL
jgi:hypothetical protein